MTAPTKPTIDEQIERVKYYWRGYPITAIDRAILATLERYKRIMEAKRPEPVATINENVGIDPTVHGCFILKPGDKIYGPDLLAAYDRVAAERDEAVELRQKYDTWLSNGVYYTTEEYTKLVAERKAELEHALTCAETAERQLAEAEKREKSKHERYTALLERHTKQTERLAELQAKHDALVKWLDNNTTFTDSGNPVLASVSKRIWYHATDDTKSYPFSAMSAVALDKGGE